MVPEGDIGVDQSEWDRHHEALADLTSAMAAGGESLEERVERVLGVGCEHLEYPTAFLSIVTDARFEIRVASGQNDDFTAGAEAPLEETYCKHTLDESGLCVIADASRSMPDDPAYARWGLESYVGTPVDVDGEMYGTLCFADAHESRSEFTEWQRALLTHLREWVESELERERIAELRDRHSRLLEATFNSPDQFVGIVDTDGTLLRANETALEFVDASLSEVRGRHFAETPWWDHDASLQRRCRDALQRASDGETVSFEAYHVGADGERIETAVTVRPVFDEHAVTEIIVEGMDVTDLTEREAQMEFFNGILRHDILNGMNVIRARASQLEADLDGEHAEFARTIVDWSDDIIDLTEKVRSVLATLSGDGLTDPEPIDLVPALESAAHRASAIDDSCSVSIDVDDVTVAADELLSEVFGNVFANAAEHGGPNTDVEVTATVLDDAVVVRIADDGPGIPPEERDRIFERGAKRADSSGTGFGLYFVATMVDSYGGDIRAEESEAGGVAFVVELPLYE